MEMQNRYATKYESHMFMMKETYEETDIKGNNNRFNSLKTETSINHAHEPSSLFQVNCTKEKKLEVDNSLFSYSSFKKAMDLRTHNRTLDGKKRTIFDDAEYFAKNYCYKLLPITFEQVDETIIQSEHNYSLSSLNSESELEEDCSRTMDYSQVKEKNYKRRKTKFQEGEEDVEEEQEEQEVNDSEISDGDRKLEVEPSSMLFHPNEDFATKYDDGTDSESLESENSIPVQPLDLSTPPLVQEEKTDHHLRERPNSIVGNDEIAQPDSDKENVNSELNGIRVTITRPDEKENYQPCDLFLNDIARLVPWLIDKDCCEVDILDRTCDHHDEFQNHRLYYVISETTWRLFQESNERIILTNDQSLGQPLIKDDKDEKPSYLVFDQFSLAKCLADYCKEIGGCFEYSCIEEGKDEGRPKDQLPGDEVKSIEKTSEEVKKVNEIEEREKILEEVKEDEKENVEVTERGQKKVEADEKAKEKEVRRTDEKVKEKEVLRTDEKAKEKEVRRMDEKAKEKEVRRTDEKVKEKEVRRTDEKAKEKEVRRTDEKVKEKEVLRTDEKAKEKEVRRMDEKVKEKEVRRTDEKAKEKEVRRTDEKAKEEVRRTDENLKTCSLKKRKKKGKEDEVNEVKLINNDSLEKEVLREEDKETVCEKKVPRKTEKKNSKPAVEEVNEKRAKTGAVTNKEAKKQIRGLKRRKNSPIQPEPNNCRITTRSKSTSGSETSQKSDKPVNRKGRKTTEAPTLLKEPPTKRNKPAESEDFRRKTRSGKVLEEAKANKSTGATEGRKRSEGSRGRVKEEEEVGGRRLRSQKKAQGRGEQGERGEGTVKTRTRKRFS